jgi:hypothetical protein
MKTKLYKKTLLILLFFSSLHSYSQPLTGVYTIGGITPDYATIGGAVSAIQTNGVSGPVTFNIRDGIYNEKLIMYQFAGSSATNTVTFKSESGDSSLVTISDSSSASSTNNFTVQIFGADNVLFRRVTIQRPGGNQYGSVIEIGNSSNNITISHCQLAGGTAGGASLDKCIIFSNGTSVNNDVTIADNLFSNGSYAIYKQASGVESGNAVTDNIFQNQTGGGIFVQLQNGILVSRNQIISTGSNSYTAISFNQCKAGSTANKNKIAISSASSGIQYISCPAVSGAENIASNNFIQIGGTSANAGIDIFDSPFINLYYNSVNRSGNGASSAALFLTGATSDIQLINNILVNSAGGYAINSAVSGTFLLSDYNDLFTTGVNVGNFNGTPAPALADWQTLSGMDTNSVSADPVFISATDLHASSIGVNDMGTVIPAINTDIDGETRSGSAPDPGADEFTPLTDNISLLAIPSPADYACGDSSIIVQVVIQNLGLNNATSVPVTVEITGPSVLTLTDTVIGPMLSYEVDTLTFTGTLNAYSGGSYSIKAYTSLPGDLYLLNDTLTVTRTILGIPNAPTALSPQAYCENSIQLTANSDSGTVLYWYDAPAGGNLLFTGPIFSPAVTGDTTFYVESHSGTGTSGCLRLTEMATESASGSDHLEIQNCSAGPVNVNGWFLVISDDYSDINIFNAITWDLTSIGTFAPGQIAVRDDDASSPDYWGSNIFWSSGSNSWAMIVDNLGNVVDFASWGWTAPEIQSLNITVNGFPITIGNAWTGDGMSSTCGSGDAISRMGSSDNDNATDFTCMAASKGILNSSLSIPFPACGANACGSERIPVELTVYPAAFVDLGPDTISGVPYLLDAGTAASYLWSNSATTQTITVSSSGVYSVTITDANGCTAMDSVNLILTIGIDEINSLNNFSVFPNPVNDMVAVSFVSMEKQYISIRLINTLGEEIISKNLNSFSGPYHENFNVEDLAPGIYNLEIRTAHGILNKKLVVK